MSKQYPLNPGRLARDLPKTIVSGSRANLDDKMRDTPMNRPPKPPAETYIAKTSAAAFSAGAVQAATGSLLTRVSTSYIATISSR